MKNNQPIAGLILMGLILFLMAVMSSCGIFKGAEKTPKITEVKKISFDNLNKESTEGVDAYILITPDSIRGEDGEFIFWAYDANGVGYPFLTKNPAYYQIFKKKGDDKAIWLSGANIKPFYLWQDKTDSSISTQKLQEMDKRKFFLIMGQRVIGNDLLPEKLRKKVLPTSTVVDADGDGISDKDDLEPNTLAGTRVDSNGVTAIEPVDSKKQEVGKAEPTKIAPTTVKKPAPVKVTKSWPTIRK